MVSIVLRYGKKASREPKKTDKEVMDGNGPSGFTGDANVSQDVNVLALVKGTERYVFLYSDENRAETFRTFARYASNPDLSFTWYDAAVLSQKIRQDSLHHAEIEEPVE
ncbi:MAG: hypothetical protein Q4D98_08335 [Planctomycetia bacterium]|nr:hypothetical protein [Planctomycetia bacterium]